MNHHIDQEVVAGFISEAKGYLPEIMLGLESFAADINQLASLREAFRYAHIIKGAGSMLGFTQISEVAYHLEVTLEMLCEEHLPLSQELLEDLCQNVGDLAELLDKALTEAPATNLVSLPAPVSNDQQLSTSELSTDESLTTKLSTDELSTAEQSVPELLMPDAPPDPSLNWSETLLPSADADLPGFALTPSAFEETGETILLAQEEEEILPEARTTWQSYVAPEDETEEPLVSLLNETLNETSFSVSLPETTETPTIGDLDLQDVAKELQENYGAYPSLPQPEFNLPDELMAALPELQLDAPSEEVAQLCETPPEMALELLPATEMPAEMTDEANTSESLPMVTGDVLEASEPMPTLSYDEVTSQDDEDILAATDSLPSEMDFPESLPVVAGDVLEASAQMPTLSFDESDEDIEDILAAPDSLPAEMPHEATVLEGDSFIAAAADEDCPPDLPNFEMTSLPVPVFEEVTEEAFEEALPESIVAANLEQQPADEEFTPSMNEVQETSDQGTADLPAPAAAKPVAVSFSSPAISDEMADELMETFLLEAEEHLQNLQTSFRVLYKNPNNRDLLQEVRRSSHSLKGTAAMVGLDNIMHLAHRMEDVLDLIYDGEMQLTQERTLLLMQATDALEDMSNGQSNANEVQRLYDEFTRLLAQDASPSSTPEETIETAPELIIATTPEVGEPAASDMMMATVDDATAILVDNSEPVIQTASEAEALLPEWPFELPVDPIVEATTENLDELAISLEPPVEMVSELPMETASEAMPELPPLLELSPMPTVTEPEIVPAQAAIVPVIPEAVAEPVVTKPTVVHEPEVLPASQTGAMTQASNQFVRVPIERLDDVVKLISEMIITRTMFEQRLADFGRQVEELQMTGTRLRRASSNLESKYEVSTLGGGRPSFLPNNTPPGLSASDSLAANGLVNSLVTHNMHGFDDLEFDRYTEFHLVSRELVESSTDIQTLGRELNHLNSDFLSYLNRQGRIYSDLQDRLMRLRMVPLASLAPRLHRTVRTVSVQQHKDVELILEGESTAIDTTALQEMTDPLLHLLRNAVDHGIETTEARIAKGKSAAGKIILRAFYEGSQVVIQLRDDGQGLDLNRIRNRAMQHGLITAAEAESMSQQELWALILTPGFSTAETVSEISGRGVGMDVVHTTVQKLRGTISIDSQPNAGTTFTIRLPLTLAVTRSLMVKANGQMFAIPLDIVSQIMRIEMSKVERIGKEPVIRLGGKVYPLLMLSRLLNLRQSSDDVLQRPPALLLRVEGKEVVVIVDQLMGGREVVIKTLGNHLRKIHGVMGATLMGDGEVVLILNLAELLRGTVRLLPRRAVLGNPLAAEQATLPDVLPNDGSAPVIPSPKAKTINQTLTIMIVDDSPSVRRVSSNMIKNIGWLPTLAKDGLDALEQLQASETPPDLILLDIEMPRMDGYQFLSSVRSLPAYRHLPVVIVSSRSSEKHRQKAFDLGATEYLVKPYQEDHLITLIRRLVRESHQ